MRPLAYALALFAPLAFNGTAHADDYGCKVLLCLADPSGPMAQNECKPPIRRFIEGQSKHPRDPFPTCEEGAPAMMKPAMRMFDACPEGTDTLPSYRLAVQLTPTIYTQLTKGTLGNGMGINLSLNQPVQLPPEAIIQLGIGEGETSSEGKQDKVCVGKPLGLLFVDAGAEQNPRQVDAFERIVTMAPAATPRVVDIFISGQLYRSTRY